LVAWWRAESNALDQVGTHHGTMLNGATFAPGRVGQAFSFDGVNDCIEVGSGFNLDDLTLEAWVLIDPATNTGERRILSKDNSDLGGTRKAMALKSSAPSITGGQGRAVFVVLIGDLIDAVEAPFALTAGWHHLAGVRDTDLGRFELYVDGVMVKNKPTVSAIGPIDSMVNAVIGQVSPAYNGEFFAGLIDELAIYSRALSSNEIAVIFNAGSAGKCPPSCTPAPSGLIHWYRAESDGRDSAGTNHGSLESGVTAGNAGQVGGAFQFDGSSFGGGVNLGNVPDLDFTSSDSFSIEAWFNSFGPSPPPNDGQIIVRLNNQCVGGSPDQSIGMGNNQGSPYGEVFFQVRDVNGITAAVTTPAALTSNQFHHVVGVREVNGGAKTVRLYVDGALVGSQPDLSTGSLAINAPDLIGRRNVCGSDNTFNGLIDEVSIYNRALAANEIAAIFAAGTAGKCTAPSLTIFRSTTNTAVVSWPSPSTDFGLQQNTNGVSSVNWSNVATAPADNGTNKFIIFDPPIGNRFYRLFKP
jgi:hypothetical protein